jgi:5-methylcytosine-specific restriction protein A
LRAQKLAETKYLCENCLAKGRTTPAAVVHHVKPVEAGISDMQMRSLCFDYSNLQSLCHECHNEAHRELKSYAKESVKNRNTQRTGLFVSRFLKA